MVPVDRTGAVRGPLHRFRTTTVRYLWNSFPPRPLPRNGPLIVVGGTLHQSQDTSLDPTKKDSRGVGKTSTEGFPDYGRFPIRPSLSHGVRPELT